MRVFFSKCSQMCPHLQIFQVPKPLVLCGDPANLHTTPNGSRQNGGVWYMKNRAPPLFMRVSGHFAEIFRN